MPAPPGPQAQAPTAAPSIASPGITSTARGLLPQSISSCKPYPPQSPLAAPQLSLAVAPSCAPLYCGSSASTATGAQPPKGATPLGPTGLHVTASGPYHRHASAGFTGQRSCGSAGWGHPRPAAPPRLLQGPGQAQGGWGLAGIARGQRGSALGAAQSPHLSRDYTAAAMGEIPSPVVTMLRGSAPGPGIFLPPEQGQQLQLDSRCSSLNHPTAESLYRSPSISLPTPGAGLGLRGPPPDIHRKVPVSPVLRTTATALCGCGWSLLHSGSPGGAMARRAGMTWCGCGLCSPFRTCRHVAQSWH